MRPLRLVIAALLLAAPTAWAGPAAERSAACPGIDGVTVVVDFGSLGGGTQVRCTSGNPSSGLDALSRAGFSYGFRPNFPGMVCTIDDKPDPCNGAPPEAYWAYWHAERGGSWTYSKQGAASRTPPPGSVEGWAFGAGRSPSSAPPPSVATTTTARANTVPPPDTGPSEPPSKSPTTLSPTTTTEPVVATGSASSGAASTVTSTVTTDESSTETSTVTSSTEGSTATSLPENSGEADVDDERGDELAAEGTSAGGGGILAAAIGLAVLAALVAAATWELRRRREAM